MAVSDQPWYADRRPSPAKTAFPDPRRLPPRHCRGDRLPTVGRPPRSRPRPFLSRPLCGGAKSKYDVARLGVQREHGAEMARKKLGQYFCVVCVYSSPFTTTPSSRPPFDDRVCIFEISPPPSVVKRRVRRAWEGAYKPRCRRRLLREEEVPNRHQHDIVLPRRLPWKPATLRVLRPTPRRMNICNRRSVCFEETRFKTCLPGVARTTKELSFLTHLAPPPPPPPAITDPPPFAFPSCRPPPPPTPPPTSSPGCWRWGCREA